MCVHLRKGRQRITRIITNEEEDLTQTMPAQAGSEGAKEELRISTTNHHEPHELR